MGETSLAGATDDATAPSKSNGIKHGRGGNRPSAGRKPNLAKRLLKGFTRETIAQAAADIDVGAVIVGLLKCKSERTRLETFAFLRDTLYGRPAQNVSLSGAVVHAHGLWRPLENPNRIKASHRSDRRAV